MGLSPKSMSIAILVLFVAAATACGTDRGSPTTGPAAAFGSEPTVSSNDTVPTSQSTATPVPTVYPTLESRRAPTPTPRAYIEINPTIKSFPDIPPPKGPNLEPPYLGGDEILKRIGEFAPTFGGLYMYEGNLVIIINDDTQIDRAVAAIAAYYGPDRITDTVLIERGRYDFKQLSAWYRIANDLVWNLGGVSSSHIDESNGRINFGVVTEKTAEAGRAALEGSGIPPEVVVFDVKPRIFLDAHETNLRSSHGIEISLEAPQQVRVGKQVNMTLVLTNRGTETVEFIYAASVPDDILVYRGGIEIWSKNGRVGARTLAARLARLEPGEELRLDTVWPVIDNDFEPLPPAEYMIAAKMWVGEERPRAEEGSNGDLATEPVALTILPE